MSREERVLLWRRAAVLGSLWAASEIVFGSFLHNARVPLTGNVLTGIGIATLVAGHRLWPGRGLLWRAGLICAAMKSVSPSAVILAPMLAISMEGLLLEAGVLLGGANPGGYLLAGALAMSWPLLHRIGAALIIYGPQAWTLYVRGLEQARAWLHLSPGSPWTPLLLLWLAHLLGGVLAAAIGLRVGAAQSRAARAAPPAARPCVPPAPGRSASLAALLLHLCAVTAFLALAGRLAIGVFVTVAAGYAALCAWSQPRARKVLGRLSLWAGWLTAALLAGLVLGHWQAGAQMGCRALVLTLGFSCIGSELRNPVLRQWLERRGGSLFLAALEQAFASLPAVLAGLPQPARLLRSPVAALSEALGQAPLLLEGLQPGRVAIITGEQGEGKSNLALALARALRQAGLSVGGIHAPGFWEDGRRSGFDVTDLASGESRSLCRTQGPEAWTAQGPFRFCPEGLAFGRQALARALQDGPDVVIVDEVGPLELRGQGWAEQLEGLVRQRRKPMVWVVRRSLVAEVGQRWGLDLVRAFDAGGADAPLLAGQILGFIRDDGKVVSQEL